MTATDDPTTAEPTACPACGEALPADARFCEACGAAVDADAAPAPTRVELAATPTAAPDDPLASALPVHDDCGGVFRDGWCDLCGEREPDPRWSSVHDVSPRLGGASDRGRRHHENEDALALHDDGTTMVAVVCDGVSSTVDPERASAAAVEAALGVLRSDPSGLEAAHRAADDAVRRLDFTPRGDLDPPSATFLAVTVDAEGLVRVGSLGDCRAYWLPDDEAEAGRQLTTDDSWAQVQVERGMDPDEALAHPSAHVISRWLGRDADPAWAPRETTLRPDGPGRVVACSDGLWNHAPTPAALAAVVAPDATPVAQARAWVAFANAAGGHDNITVAVARVGPPSTAPTTPPPPTSPAPTDAPEPPA